MSPSLEDAIGIPVLLLAGGLLAGTLGGLLGIGGGIVLMPLLRLGLGLSPAEAAGTCILAVFFTTLGGSYRHLRQGNLHLPSLAPVMISGVIASALFSVLFHVISQRSRWFDFGIGLVFVLVAARMIGEGLGRPAEGPSSTAAGTAIRGTRAQKIGIGATAGMLPGLLGIGTGGILVPAFRLLLRAPVKVAMAASLACFCCNAFVSAGFKIAQSHVALELALPACVGTFVGATVGATLNRRWHSRVLAMLFGLLFAFVAARFLLLAAQVPR
jgi:uncharacterized membrane protein YfcA